MRLQRDVHSGAAGELAGFFKREDFGVFHALRGVETASHDVIVAHDYGANNGIRRNLAEASRGQLQRFFHVAGH